MKDIKNALKELDKNINDEEIDNIMKQNNKNNE